MVGGFWWTQSFRRRVVGREMSLKCYRGHSRTEYGVRVEAVGLRSQSWLPGATK